MEHMFETEEGPKEEWRGMVLARAPIMTTWFYITYEKDPVLYMYQLLDDYKEGDLRIMPDSSEYRKRNHQRAQPLSPGSSLISRHDTDSLSAVAFTGSYSQASSVVGSQLLNGESKQSQRFRPQ